VKARVGAYAMSVAAVGVAIAGTFVIQPWIAPSISVLFFPAVVVPAIYGGYGPALLATVLSTGALAYLFVPPRYSFDIGADDAIRLAVFALVALATAWVSSARRRAEEAQRESVRGLQAAVDTLRKVSGWPLVIDSDMSASMRRILAHGAAAVGASTAVAVWEAEEEPWVYVTSTGSGDDTTSRHAPTDFAPMLASERAASTAIHADAGDVPSIPSRIRALLPPGALALVPFHAEHLAGRVLFGGLDVGTRDVVPTVDVVAREIGNSLAHLHVAERSQALAIREDRLRVSRDLHDGVLQALTGIRLELQDIAEDCTATPATQDRLLAAERALAIEQRELRTFIDGLKPDGASAAVGTLAASLEETAARLAVEWKTPVTVRVAPGDLVVRASLEHAVRMMLHEAIVNALKHGHPSRVAVTVDAADSRLSLTITDDGRGFPFRGQMDHEALIRDDVGPISLRDRVAALGGLMSIDSGPRGARVEVSLPL
jgi:signal transduction histidine kinase